MTSDHDTKVWLITGCSAGLGVLLVQTARKHGYRVIATARDPESISALKEDDGIRTLQLDVTSSQEILDRKMKEAIDFFGKIDVLVNNAGYILSGVWEQISQASVYHLLETNVLGPLRLTRALLPYLRRQGGGSVVFIGSMAGWVGAAAAGPYSMTKFALEGAAECLQKEVAEFNVQIYIFALGQFRTNVLNANRRKYDEEETLPEYRDLIQSLKKRHEHTDGKQRGDPALAAEHVVGVLGENKMKPEDHSSLPVLRRVFLGPDCVNAVKVKCEATLKLIQENYEFFASTDYPEPPQTQGYQ